MATHCRFACLLLLTTTATFLVGCGRSDLPPLAKVYGVVLLDGSPLPDGVVTFKPLAGGRPSKGSTDSAGKFTLGTFAPGDGALIGQHQLAVNPLQPVPAAYLINPEGNHGYQPPFPEKYWTPGTSGLVAEVQSDRENQVTLELYSEE